MHKGYLSEFGMKKPVNRIQSSCSWSWSSPAARTCSGWLAGRCYCCLSGEEFKCHKVILAGRSTVFDAMFTHDLMEKNENKVEVEDVDADNIKEMLVFIYSGKVLALNLWNSAEVKSPAIFILEAEAESPAIKRGCFIQTVDEETT